MPQARLRLLALAALVAGSLSFGVMERSPASAAPLPTFAGTYVATGTAYSCTPTTCTGWSGEGRDSMALTLSGACDGIGYCVAHVDIDPQWMPSASGCYGGRRASNDYAFTSLTSSSGPTTSLVVHFPTASTPADTVTGTIQSGTGQFGFLEGFSFEAVRTGPPTNPCTCATVPTAPINVTAAPGTGQAVITFTPGPATDPAVDGWMITPYVGYYPLPPRVFISTATSFPLRLVQNGITRRFIVRGINECGLGPPSRASNPVTTFQ